MNIDPFSCLLTQRLYSLRDSALLVSSVCPLRTAKICIRLWFIPPCLLSARVSSARASTSIIAVIVASSETILNPQRTYQPIPFVNQTNLFGITVASRTEMTRSLREPTTDSCARPSICPKKWRIRTTSADPATKQSQNKGEDVVCSTVPETSAAYNYI